MGSTLGVLTVCLAAAALAATAIAVVAPMRQPAPLRQSAGARLVNATIRVDSATQPASLSRSHGTGAGSGQIRFHGTMTEVRDGSSVISLSGPALVFVPLPREQGSALEIGSTVIVHGTLVAGQPEEESAFLVFGRAEPKTVESAPWYLAWANSLRAGFSQAASSLPGDGGKLLPGLSIGDVGAVSPQLDSAMKASSLSHLTAVSGANCAVIMALVMLLGAACGLRRGFRISLSLVALLGFVILVTPGPSVLRAAVMATIVVFSLGAGRPGRGMPAMGLAVVVLLVADPWLARSYGFALSVLATAGLLILSGPLARVLSRWMPLSLATLISIPLAAQLACQPVLILLTPSLPLYGVTANLLAEPAAPVATVLGLIACLILPGLPGVGMACAQLAWAPSAWIASVASVTTNLPGSRLPWLGGVAGVALLALLTVLVLILLLRSVGAKRTWLSTSAIALLIVVVAGYAGSTLGSGVGRRLSMPADWQIGACDIGQGDAVLLRSGRFYALVDVGPDPEPLTRCLDALGIDRINLLVLTHFDKDHVGGLQAVLGRVDTALVGPPEDRIDQALIDILARRGADVRRAASGDHGTLGRLDWSVLWPTAGSKVMQTGNEGCVTVAFAGAGIRSIFLCDLGERAQNALLATNRVRAADVVKVAHHGSADQSERMYQALQARLGLISVGLQNDYGHPTATLLGILGRVGTMALRTDLEGMILVGPSPTGDGSMTVWTEHQPSAGATGAPRPNDTGRG